MKYSCLIGKKKNVLNEICKNSQLVKMTNEIT